MLKEKQHNCINHIIESNMTLAHCRLCGIPVCVRCGKFMNSKYDEISKKITGHLWLCECNPELTISIG